MNALPCDLEASVKSMGSGARQSSNRTLPPSTYRGSILGHLSKPWFSLGNMEVIIVPSSQGAVRIQWGSTGEILSSGLPRATLDVQ